MFSLYRRFFSSNLPWHPYALFKVFFNGVPYIVYRSNVFGYIFHTYKLHHDHLSPSFHFFFLDLRHLLIQRITLVNRHYNTVCYPWIILRLEHFGVSNLHVLSRFSWNIVVNVAKLSMGLLPISSLRHSTNF